MKNYFFLPAFFLFALAGSAQNNNTIEVPLAQYAKDDRFDKYQLTLALFKVKGDTILSMDFEGTRPVQIIRIKKTGKHKEFAYVAHRKLKAVPSPFGHKYEVKLKKISLDKLEKKTCKASKKSSGRMKSSRSKLLTKRKFKKN
jgi:hypothetical protein